MTEVLWALLGLLIGWKAAAATGGNPAAVPSAASSVVKNTVHQAVTQASDTVLSVIWSVAWHAAVVIAVVAVLFLAFRAGVLQVIRRVRANIPGRWPRRLR
jgi:hypothetical protein